MKPIKVLQILLLAAVMLSALSSMPAFASWQINGNPVCTAANDQLVSQIVSDGVGGAYVTWYDFLSVDDDIYAQRVDANGIAMWTGNGVAICTAASYQRNPRIALDGAGGAILTWYDRRNGNEDIYAQRVDASGNAMWAPNGVAICSAANAQAGQQIVSDGAGGAIITWWDNRNPGGTNLDIYAQRVDASGNAMWAPNGVAICSATNHQGDPQIISDGAGGAIITWWDNRNGGGGNVYDIYAQRVDASGNALWTADGAAICTNANNQVYPQIASDGAGGAIITWQDERNGNLDVYAQRIDAAGNVMWTTDGVPACVLAGSQDYPFIASDGAGGAVITWQDNRSGSGCDIYAQRLDGSGGALWGSNGAAVCTKVYDQFHPQIISGGPVQTIIAWSDYRSGGSSDIYAQRMDANGNAMWTADGVPVCTDASKQEYPYIASDGVGGAFVAWWDYRNGSCDVYAQRVSDNIAPVATQLQSYDAFIAGSDVYITWVLSEAPEGLRFSVARMAAHSGAFEEVSHDDVAKERLSFSFKDETAEPGTSYIYRVQLRDEAGERVLFETGLIAVPRSPLTLHQNHPNPFNPSTTIRYFLPEKERVRLAVFDVSGKQIICLVDAEQEKGTHSIEWNGLDAQSRPVASGVYLCRLVGGKDSITRKMMLLK
jgi:hypothetical protein